MLLPIRTSIRPRQTPYANYVLIVANALIFFLTYAPHRNTFTGAVEILRPWAGQFMLTPVRPYLWQFVKRKSQLDREFYPFSLLTKDSMA